MPKGVVVAVKSGKKMKVAPRVEVGLVPCVGEAHDPAVAGGIDHCGLCAPRWGYMTKYEEPSPEACEKGFAVPVGWTREKSEAAFAAAETEGKVKMVEVKETTRSYKSYFNAWVKA